MRWKKTVPASHLNLCPPWSLLNWNINSVVGQHDSTEEGQERTPESYLS